MSFFVEYIDFFLDFDRRVIGFSPHEAETAMT